MADVSELPEPFNFYRLVLESEHLHFGLWPEGEDSLSLEQAQDKMFQAVRNLLPEPPASVLDVGCGLGLSAYLLATLGYHVTAIAPSEEMVSYARGRWAWRGLEFLNEGFLDRKGRAFIKNHYEVILFQESLQYLRPLSDVFKRARELLKPQGYVIIADEVRLSGSVAIQTAVHSHHDIRSSLCEHGFCVLVEKDVSKNTLPTCDEVIERLNERFETLVTEAATENAQQRLSELVEGWKRQKKFHQNGQMGYVLMAARKDRIFLRPYRQGDEKGILRLFKIAFGTERTIEHWTWKFKENPYGNLKIVEAVNEEGKLQAHYAGYPVPFYMSGSNPERMTAFQIGDTMTDPSVRFSGIGRRSVLGRATYYFYDKFCVEQVPFIYGFNTGKIKKLGERFLGYDYLEPISYFVKTLSQESRWQRAWNHIASTLRRLKVRLVDEITSEYDEFFEKVAGDYGLLVERSSRYLRWRYLDCPDKRHLFFEVRKGRHLV
ncbi:MAG: hypothetical protein DRH15_11415, partial [Deltaproteobacteria bacterium]